MLIEEKKKKKASQRVLVELIAYLGRQEVCHDAVVG